VDSDLSGLFEIRQLTLLGDAWERAEIGAVVFNDARRYLAVNAAYLALTGRSREEISALRAGHNLLLGEMGSAELSQAEFIERITDHRQLDRAVIRRKDGAALPVYYMLIRSEISQLPVYIGLVWPETSDAT
jgi:PAS domain-containing protein